MTRSFNEKIRCPDCGCEHTVETDFERWVREHPQLDSIKSDLVRFDLDMLLHKYKTCIDGKGSRLIQCMMFVEIKTFMATPSPAQVDTLSMLNQVLRNRRPNVNSKTRRQTNGQATKVWSKLQRRNVTLKLYGGHLLQLDGTSPVNSSKMFWDYQEIGLDFLLDLLRFERDPDRIHLLLDDRRRSRPWKQMPLLDFGINHASH